MKFLIPIFLILLSGALFWVFINPHYMAVKELQEQVARFDEALTRSQELISTRDALLSKYNTFQSRDLERLAKILPDTVDNVRLTLDIDSIGEKYGMAIRNVSVKDMPKSATAVGPSTDPFGSIVLQFGTSGSYENFVRFLADLEQSLRIVDVTDIAFTASETDFNQYTVSLTTYWLQ